MEALEKGIPAGGQHAPHAGMPPLEAAPPLSLFEFWPAWLFYPPVWLWIAALSVRHLGVRLPLLANPSIRAGGLVGESKSAVLALPGGGARAWFAPHVAFDRGTDSPADARRRALVTIAGAGLLLPLVAKPDLGCRGAGVRPVRTEAELETYLAGFPQGERLVLQALVGWEGEAGIFWVKRPGETQGRILSLTLKYFPHVVGDGRSTLKQLILADPRAGQLPQLYLGRHAERLGDVLACGAPFRLAFAGSHSRGAIFRDGTHLVTPAMEARFEAICADIPEFWFGRFDVRFADIADLQRGDGFRILEVNGAGAESTHIWDSRMSLRRAWKALFRQNSLLWAVGAANRARGFRPDGFADLWRGWRRERALIPTYPPTA
jgi:hypothetical protein